MSTVAETKWTWNEAPFSTKLDARRFFPGSTQEEALSRMHFLVDNRRRVGVLSGPSGCGKSMILEVASKQFRQQNRQVCSIGLTGLQADEFLWRLAAEMGANPCINSSSRQLWREIDDRIKASRYQRISTILIFDDVEEAETEVLSMLGRLAQSDQSDDSRLTLLFACEQSRLHLLGDRLQELCELRVEIEPWSEEETINFIRHALTAAACGTDLFTEDSERKLFELTQGVPRRVQQLAQLSLVAAAAQDLEAIDVGTLEAVFDELSGQADWD